MRITVPTVVVLDALASGRGYGFEIIDATGLGAGTVYPILRRLEAESLVRSSWERVAHARAEGRPPRRNYRLTEAGQVLVREAAQRYPGLVRPVPAAGEGASA